MAFKRIRYSKTQDPQVYESVKTYQHPTEGSRYRVMLNRRENQWLVVDTTCDLIAASGHMVNFNKMKIEAKEALQKLGIEFVQDARKPYRKKEKVNEQQSA